MCSLTQSGIQKLEKVEITLADCLACSGCITSAEGVLISQQSQEELLRVMNANNLAKLNGQHGEVKFIVFTVSQQPILSLARKYNLNAEETFEHIAGKITHAPGRSDKSVERVKLSSTSLFQGTSKNLVRTWWWTPK